MTSTRRPSKAVPFALFGVVFPYAVAILSSALFRESIRSVDYYASGRLATLDTITTWITLAAFVLGSSLCWPWFRSRLARTAFRVRWFVLGVIALFVQFVAVFVTRFVVYVSFGGIL